MSGGAVQKGDLFVFYGLLKQGAAGQPADLPLEVLIIGAMDEFEDVTDDPATSLYIRQQIPLLDDHGAPTGERAWIYWYNQPTEGFTDIPDGNWPLDRGRTRK